MKRLLQTFAAVLALVWVPITSHCSWEEIVGGDVFQCAPGAEEKGDCSGEDGDSCVAVESGCYKVPDTTLEVPAPVFALIVFELAIPLSDLPQQSPPRTLAPPEIGPSWLFFSRTALPPRPPSLA